VQSTIPKRRVEVTKKATRAVLIISGQCFPFSNWIDSKEIKKILLTTPQTKAAMDFATLKSYDLIECFDNFGTNNLVEYRAYQLHKIHQFSQVICLSEEEMLRTAIMRECFGLKSGQSYESTLRFRDKVLMKTILRKTGLKVPNFAKIDNAIDLFNFIKENNYPVVVKPIRGYGSVNTSVIKNEEEFHKFCVTGFSSALDASIDMMVESFVYGKMYHIDGLFYDGKARLIWPSRYVNTVVNFNENNFIAGYSLQPSNPLTIRIQQFVNDCLEALDGPPTYPFHAEVWHTPEDDLVFCEVASRTGGGGIPTQITSLFAVSLSKTHTQYQADVPITLETKDILWKDRLPLIPDSLGWIFVYPKMGKVTLPRVCNEDYVLSYEPFAETGQIYNNRKSCADAVCNFLIRGNSEEEAEKNIHNIYNWFTNNTKWDPIET